MPTSSADAANAWRAIHAPPRAKRKTSPPAPSPISKTSTKPPAPRTTAPAPSPAPSSSPSSPEVDSTALQGTAEDCPSESLRRARSTERASYKNLERLQRDKLASAEDLRKASSIYFASRSNRQKAEADHREWQRAEGITLFADEARDLASRPALAAHGMLQTAAKTLAIRCHGQSVKACEKVIGDWVDRLSEILRSSF
jgi:hypothetical protein